MVSEHNRSMAPSTTPTVAQRVEELEDAMGSLETRVSRMVSQAVDNAVVGIRNSVLELLVQGQKENAKKNSEDMDKMMSEIRSALTGLQSQQPF